MRFRLKQNDQIGLIFFSALVIGTSLIWLFEERFNEIQWKDNYDTRYKMADDIVDSEDFINKTEQQLLIILGKPDDYNLKGEINFVYYLAKKPSLFNTKPTQLIFRLKNNHVFEVIREDR